MMLATAAEDGMPSARVVLLHGHDGRGFVFYTNLGSRKVARARRQPARRAVLSMEITAPAGADRGQVEPVAEAEADAYFAGRPRDSQIGAWASDQSRRWPIAASWSDRVADVHPALWRERRASAALLVGFSPGAAACRILAGAAVPAARSDGCSPAKASDGDGNGCSRDPHERAAQTGSAGRATYASVAVAAVLIAVKFVAWLETGSVALLSSLIDSLLDAAASLVNLFAVRHAMSPADREHRFGHGKAEPLAVLAQSAFIAGSALLLMAEAVRRLISADAGGQPAGSASR